MHWPYTSLKWPWFTFNTAINLVPFESGCCIHASSPLTLLLSFQIWRLRWVMAKLSKKTRMHFRSLNNSDSCFSRSQRHLRLFPPPLWQEVLVQSLATERNVLQWDIKQGSRREVFDIIANKPLNQRKQKWNQKGSECFWEIYHGSSKTACTVTKKKKVTWKKTLHALVISALQMRVRSKTLNSSEVMISLIPPRAHGIDSSFAFP